MFKQTHWAAEPSVFQPPAHSGAMSCVKFPVSFLDLERLTIIEFNRCLGSSRLQCWLQLGLQFRRAANSLARGYQCGIRNLENQSLHVREGDKTPSKYDVSTFRNSASMRPLDVASDSE